MQDCGDFSLSITEVLARTVGLEAVAALKQHCGGMILYIPSESKIGADHRLSLAVGLEAARKVCRELHRTKQYVPRQSSDFESIVLWAARAGLKRQQTADLANCTEAWVYKIVANAREAGILPSDEAHLWEIMGYDSPEASPEANEHLRRLCRGGQIAHRRLFAVAWAKLAGITSVATGNLVDIGPGSIGTMVSQLADGGYLPKRSQRRKS